MCIDVGKIREAIGVSREEIPEAGFR